MVSEADKLGVAGGSRRVVTQHINQPIGLDHVRRKGVGQRQLLGVRTSGIDKVVAPLDVDSANKRPAAIALAAGPDDGLFARWRSSCGKRAELAPDDRSLIRDLRQLAVEGGNVGIEGLEPFCRGWCRAGGG